MFKFVLENIVYLLTQYILIVNWPYNYYYYGSITFRFIPISIKKSIIEVYNKLYGVYVRNCIDQIRLFEQSKGPVSRRNRLKPLKLSTNYGFH